MEVSKLITIPTLLQRRSDGIHAFAYCPFCDEMEQSLDAEYNQERALAASVAKIRKHMHRKHRRKADALNARSKTTQKLVD
jgi:hypothetical protein